MVVVVICGEGAARRTLLGLLTICWVMPVNPAPLVRNWVAVARVCSGKSIVWAGWPIVNGLMLTSGMDGPPGAVLAVPCNRIVVPCGMDARRATVRGSWGSPVPGTVIHRPGSKCWFCWCLRRRSAAGSSAGQADVGHQQATVRDVPQGRAKVELFTGHVELEEAVLPARLERVGPPDDVEALAGPVPGEPGSGPSGSATAAGAAAVPVAAGRAGSSIGGCGPKTKSAVDSMMPP